MLLTVRVNGPNYSIISTLAKRATTVMWGLWVAQASSIRRNERIGIEVAATPDATGIGIEAESVILVGDDRCRKGPSNQ